MKTCVGWLLDLYVEDDSIIIWIKAQKGKALKFIDDYNPYFYILPKTEYDGEGLYRILSQQTDIVTKVSWEYKLTNLFDQHHDDTSRKKLIFVAVDSVGNYKHLLKMLEKDSRVKQLFNTDLLDVQKYLFTKLQIEPTSKVEVEYDGLRLYKISRLNDDREISPPPFSILYADVKTARSASPASFSYRIISHHHDESANNPITSISVRYQNYESVLFKGCEEKTILENFTNYVVDKDPDIILCRNDSNVGSSSRVFQDLRTRTSKLGLETIHFGRENDISGGGSINLSAGRVIIDSSSSSSGAGELSLIELVERSRFSFLPLGLVSQYGPSRLIDSRNCYELLQRGFVIPHKKNAATHEQMRTVENIVENDKGGMIISPQIGLHENVVVLDYESEYANLIVNHNLSYETVASSMPGQSNAAVASGDEEKKKALLPKVVEMVLKRRTYFKELLKQIPKENIEESFWCEQRIEALKKILVCLYGTTGSIWNRFGNVFAFEEINRLAREVLLKTKDIIQLLGFELVYADTDSVFLKKDGATRSDYENVEKILSSETGLSISVDYHYKFLVLLPLEADEKIEALKHYFGITCDGEIITRGIETRRHDTPNFIKQFQYNLLSTLFSDRKDSSEVITRGHEDALLLVTQAIDKIMTGEGITQEDLVISKLLRLGAGGYKSIFPHVSAAIQLSTQGKTPMKGENIRYIYTNSKHKNPLCRVAPVLKHEEEEAVISYDKEKYCDLLLDAAETVLGYFGFDGSIYRKSENRERSSRQKKWWYELREERSKDIEVERDNN